MNAHRRMEAKRARRRARTTGPTRGKVRGPETRAAARAALMCEGERRNPRDGVVDAEGGGVMPELHDAVRHLLQYFEYDHLPEFLQEVSRPFRELAWDMAVRCEGPECTVGLRKLLEAKDCMVRARPCPTWRADR